MFNLRDISPYYPRIPHLDSKISKMTHDDIVVESNIDYPLDCFVGEKLDGANLGVSWYDGPPIIRNRENILRKGYSRIRTPAKEKFKFTWNWAHENKDDIIRISENLQSNITLYGEWMFAKHSVEYILLPSPFIVYDIWVVEDKKFLSPDRVKCLLGLKISQVNQSLISFKFINDIIGYSELKSDYSTGFRKGIVLKTVENGFIKNFYKVVNKHFNRREDFNKNLIKNKFCKE